MTVFTFEKDAFLPDGEIESLLAEVSAIRSEMVSATANSQTLLETIHENFRDSARNLLHYLALRRRDLRPLQSRLAALGLSSLGRAEPHVLATVDAVAGVLQRLTRSQQTPVREAVGIPFEAGQKLLVQHTVCLLGGAVPGRDVRIMVTMPGEAADNFNLVHDLLQQGMDCMRINCAHDNVAIWSKMIEHLRRAEQKLERSCKVVMDLGGPKLRTGPLEPGPSVIRVRPKRDVFGRVTAPARLWLTDENEPKSPPTQATAVIPVSSDWLSRLIPGEKIKFLDAREARRTLVVVDLTDQGCWVELTKTAYIVKGTVFYRSRREAKKGLLDSRVGDLPPGESALSLKQGGQLILTRNLVPGRPATRDRSGEVLTPASIGCTIPEVFEDAKPGESIWFDDGKIGGIIEKIENDRVLVRITHVRLRGEKLRADKGINLPDSDLKLGAMTAKDREDLEFVSQNADVVELSFANTVADVESLQGLLAHLGSRQPAIVLKIETKRGFENLPGMLLAAMRAPHCGVMIARGDLAVECGFQRLAEIQEEILWICEAAHVPVIWATQVLENLAKEGMPSRAEITDAAMGHRAECVMLNKGPHIVSAVKVLDDILRRMQAHQAKKRSMLRELRLAHGLSNHQDRHEGQNEPPVLST